MVRAILTLSFALALGLGSRGFALRGHDGDSPKGRFGSDRGAGAEGYAHRLSHKSIRYGCMKDGLGRDDIGRLFRENLPKGCPAADDPLLVVCLPEYAPTLKVINRNVRNACKEACKDDPRGADKICGDLVTNTAHDGEWCSCSCPKGQNFCWDVKFPKGKSPKMPWQPK